MRTAVILFPDEHLPYSPTVLNLRKHLSAQFDTSIIGFSNRQYNKLSEPWIHYIEIPFFYKKFYGLINKVSKKRGRELLAYIKKNLLRRNRKLLNCNVVIVTDLIGLWMVKGMPISCLHLLSLELTWNTFHFVKKISFASVASIIIQSADRLKYLTSNFKGQVFFIQNAPSFYAVLGNEHKEVKKNLIFTGTAFEKFGFLACLNFLNDYPDFNLTLQGKLLKIEAEIINEKFDHLLKEKRLIIESEYLDEIELIKKVSNYRIGFCLYDFSFNDINNINYLTAPSGKMFTCFAAGVPVIGINIPGLKPISDFNAGYLIDDLSSNSIMHAIDEIEINYQTKVNGCYKAAQHFSFSESVKPFLEFINNYREL